MTYYSNREKREVIEQLIENWRPARGPDASPGDRAVWLMLKAIAADYRARDRLRTGGPHDARRLPRIAATSAWGAPARVWCPRATIRPLFTSTAPTAGLGLVRPMPLAASRSASRMKNSETARSNRASLLLVLFAGRIRLRRARATMRVISSR